MTRSIHSLIRSEGLRKLAQLPAMAAMIGAMALVMGTSGGSTAAAAAQTIDARVADGVLRVKGTNGDDRITLRTAPGDASVLTVDVGDDGSAEFSFERTAVTEISIRARGGDDLIRIDVSVTEPALIFGGRGHDTILGGAGIDTTYGGPGDDFIDGNGAADVAFMGPGDDTFRWDPGDASDVVEGQSGTDTLLFNGANGGETADLSAVGERFRFFRQPGNITMDTNQVEVSVFNALGGPDTITVNDLTGTSVARVELDLGSDLLADLVTLNGTTGDDTIAVTGSTGSVNVTGLAATAAITSAEFANDHLEVSTAAGNDTVDSSGLGAGVIQLSVDGVPQ